MRPDTEELRRAVAGRLANGHRTGDGDPGPPEPAKLDAYQSGRPAHEEPRPPALVIELVADVAHRVDTSPPPRFLARPVWPEDAYGVIGAEDKAGKSWAGLCLAVATAAGTRWLDQYPCERPGPVLLFLGEGSDRKTIRRLRAVCEFHGVRLEDLPIRVCHRAPNLTRGDHLEAIEYELASFRPHLVVLDPLYLSLGKTKSGILSEMGDVLGGLQHSCQRVGSALVIIHHWNKTGLGNDRKRFTGSGVAEWGRVLASVSVDERTTTNGTDSLVTQTWRFMGDEIPDTTLRVSRRVWTDDPEELTSPMHYAVIPPERGPEVIADDYSRDDELRDLVLEVLSDGVERSGRQLAEAVRDAGHGARPQDVRRIARDLSDGGPVTLRLGARNAELFRAKETPSAAG